MLKKIILAVCVVGILSCSKTSGKEELPESIKQMTANSNCICEPYINLYSWKGQKVYLLANTGPVCNWIPAYYDEKGSVLTMNPGYGLDQFFQESKLIKKIWACKDGQSQFN